jgi:kumamolisin
LNKAKDSVDEMRKEVQAAQKEVQEAQKAVGEAKSSVLTISKEATDQLKQAEQKSAETQAKLEEMLQGAQQDVILIHSHAVVFESTPNAAPKPAAPSNTVEPRAFTVTEIATLYGFPSGQDGGGQTVGLIELGGGYRDADLDAYFARLHLHRPKVTAVSVDGGRNKPTGDANSADGQVMLDIEVVGAIAPAATIAVYFAPNTNAGFANAVAAATHDLINKPSVISISWGGPESSWTQPARTAFNQALITAASKQITVVAAAGDNGATDGVADGRLHVDFPASSPWALAVGGTSLLAADSTITSEKVWNDGPNGGATGGGVSEAFALPDWQSDIGVPTRKDGSLGRGVPDVAAAADPQTGYQVRVDGQWIVVGGTAAATPLWAGLVALLNQGLGHNIGYLNQRLYREIGPKQILRPIGEGNNGNGKLPGYSAGPGWSAAAGWGTPDGQKLLDWLRAHPSAP